MRENKAQRHTSENRSPCEINHLFDGASCVEAAEEKVDGLLLCERHALEAKLEGQISCWGEMLFHIDLWSREATRREREDVVGLLEVRFSGIRQSLPGSWHAPIWIDSGAQTPPWEPWEPSEARRWCLGEVLLREALPLFLQEPPGSSLEGFDVIDVDEASPDLECSLVLQSPEGPGHSLPIRTYHGA